MTDSRQLVNIQVLRGIAAYLVVIVHVIHFVRHHAGDELDRVTLYGGSGVDLFFVISGFIMVYTTMRRDTTPMAFLTNRIARVVPLYWVCTLAVFVLAIVVPSLLVSTRPDLVQLAKSLMFVPFEKRPGIIQPILFVGWTLNYEMFFYVVFALFLMLTGATRYLLLAATLAALVGAGALIGGDSLVVRFYTSPILLEFAMGALIGVACPHLPKLRSRATVGLLVAVAVALVCFLAFVKLPMHRAFAAGVPAAALVLVALVLERSGTVCPWAAPRFLGDISYSVYLLHTFVLYAVGHTIFQLVGPSIELAPLILVLVLAGVTVAGWLAWRLIERPGTVWARRLLEDLLGTGRRRVPGEVSG